MTETELGIAKAEWDESGEMIRVTRTDGLVSWVPDDMANRHRVELEQWATVKGNIIQPYAPPPTVEPKKR